MVDFATISGWASIIAIPMSIVIAIIQTVRIKKIKQNEYRDTWQLVKQVRELISKTNRDDIGKDAHENAKSIYRHLLKNAANLESKFNDQTINQWVDDGKIGDTDWQRQVARSYIKRLHS